ncbi:hypothetical protein XENTR_v10002042 [Xenopus tropicalis]|nr:hypothetical protein XENTR_v10002042 [Xenopus tropicalis]KAE8633707.1 hypothetical protein XENTR_v10002042 [Xenopus tropicalis]
MFHLLAVLVILICSLCWANVIQPPTIAVSAGMNLTLSCNHASINPADYIHWYRVPTNQRPQFMINGYKDSKQGMITLIFSKDRKSSELHIQNIKPEESGTYLCALSDTAVQPNALSVQYVDEIQ